MVTFGTRIFMFGGFPIDDLWVFDTVTSAWSCPTTAGDEPRQLGLAPFMLLKVGEGFMFVAGPVYGYACHIANSYRG